MVKHLTSTLLFLCCLAAAQDRYRIETIAGTPAPEHVPATSTYFSSPQGLAIDSSGNLYVGVVNQSRVKRIHKNTTITQTVAGNGLGIDSGDGGPAIEAGLRLAHTAWPQSVDENARTVGARRRIVRAL